MRIFAPLSALIFCLAVSAFAQPAQRFETVSIKPNNSGVERSSAALSPGGRFDATNKTFQWLLRVTFGVQDFQIAGAPGWVETDHFDIHAKADIPGQITPGQAAPLITSMLAERCGFQYHRETKELVVYSLVVEKGGPKLKEHEGAGPSTMNNESGPGKKAMQATKTSMETLAINLSRLTNRTVIDKTGLKGEYDFDLEWAPDEAADLDMPSSLPRSASSLVSVWNRSEGL
ncbi:MAG TPA: TIGR03435 family protein [Bryobacteraceae bacterium]|nr:TIGR03435 family protein [Bryobacteraceae bacterium]